jgi:CubicO group peptidase (beta-lactamase class C family)
MTGITTAPTIEGFVAPGFEAVRDAFAENFTDRAEIGASVAVTLRGRPVVDLWAGTTGRGTPWTAGTIVPIFSVTKGIAAIALTRLSSIGAIDVDRPVSEYWPEFGAAGKEAVTLRHILSHTAGLPWFDRSDEVVSFDEIDGWASRDHVEDLLAAQAPMWTPGTAVAYHSFTYGWLADAAVRRLTGRTIAEVLATDLAGPLGADLIIGYRGDPDRVALLAPPPFISEERSADSSGKPARAFFLGPKGRPMWELVGRPEYWALGGPAAGGLGNARGIARLYSLLTTDGEADGVPYLTREAIEDHTREHFSGTDLAFGFESRTGLGFGMSTSNGISFGPFETGVGFSGLGGSLGFADRRSGIAFGYAMNQLRLESYGNVSTATALLDALDASLRSGS